MGRKETDEDFEAQISFLQGQINDLEAMSKYCAKMMNSHICKIQEVILQEHLQREDEVLVSLAGLKQIKDILKGALRFNQSQLEAEENDEITIADDHYTSTAAAAETALNTINYHSQQQQQGGDEGGSPNSLLDQGVGAEEPTPPEQQVAQEGKNWDDYILVSQDGDLQAEGGGKAASERSPSIRRERGTVRIEPEGAVRDLSRPPDGGHYLRVLQPGRGLHPQQGLRLHHSQPQRPVRSESARGVGSCHGGLGGAPPKLSAFKDCTYGL
ncbi:TBC1 domain family member 5 [Oryzias melastigma]|uniref:TBC1 domain family member 5 n=1 Tax=Oryzias melastigma TaxID=30732 RepID=A0A834FPE8_ORYME|nr:TBC1 domain family member 5 [Oryzias melastigma]